MPDIRIFLNENKSEDVLFRELVEAGLEGELKFEDLRFGDPQSYYDEEKGTNTRIMVFPKNSNDIFFKEKFVYYNRINLEDIGIRRDIKKTEYEEILGLTYMEKDGDYFDTMDFNYSVASVLNKVGISPSSYRLSPPDRYNISSYQTSSILLPTEVEALEGNKTIIGRNIIYTRYIFKSNITGTVRDVLIDILNSKYGTILVDAFGKVIGMLGNVDGEFVGIDTGDSRFKHDVNESVLAAVQATIVSNIEGWGTGVLGTGASVRERTKALDLRLGTVTTESEYREAINEYIREVLPDVIDVVLTDVFEHGLSVIRGVEDDYTLPEINS